MKVAAYCPLHYGKDYLKYSLLSVYEQVEKIFILYTDKASHGYRTGLVCPETEQELIDIATSIDKDGKIFWIKGNWSQENQQRNYAHEIAKSEGFDILVALDFDEIWKEDMLKALIQLTFERKANKCLVWMRHLWKSFNWICDDPMRQERIYYLGNDKEDAIYAPQSENQVWHFGYARTKEDIHYKISIHGHSSEWLQSKESWYQNKFVPFPPVKDVHPVCADTWNPQPFDKTNLPDLMKEHPWYNVDQI